MVSCQFLLHFVSHSVITEVAPASTGGSLAQKTKSIGCCHPMLPACTLPQVLRQTYNYCIAATVKQLAWAVSLAVTAGFSLQTTPSSTAQKPFTPVEFAV